jgi:ABC-type amino acid transport substrate-binding protein
VSPLARVVTAGYVVLLLALAVLGSVSQQRYRAQARLLVAKEEAIVALVTARADAAAVNGPLAVTTWARQAGMVPAPDARQVEAVAPGLAAPTPPAPPAPGLEVATVWR